MQRLLYISESCIKNSDAEKEAGHIVKFAKIKNARLGITGALIFTGLHFAQVLEGLPESMSALMADITLNPRHQRLVIVDQSPITDRLFSVWQMAYQGPSPFVSRHLTKLLSARSRSEQRRLAEWVTELAREFTVSQARSTNSGR